MQKKKRQNSNPWSSFIRDVSVITPENMDAADQGRKKGNNLAGADLKHKECARIILLFQSCAMERRCAVNKMTMTQGCMVAEIINYPLIRAGVLVSFKRLSCIGSKYLYEYVDGGDVGKLRDASAELSFIV